MPKIIKLIVLKVEDFKSITASPLKDLFFGDLLEFSFPAVSEIFVLLKVELLATVMLLTLVAIVTSGVEFFQNSL